MLQNELDMSFNYEPITYGTIKDGSGKDLTENCKVVFDHVKYGEKDMCAAWNRVHNPGKPEKRMWFNAIITYDDAIMQTITGDHGQMFDYSCKTQVSNKSIANASTFPQDFDFCGQKIPYICGMSVPPIMIKRVVTRLIEGGYSMLQNELDMSFNYDPIYYGEIKSGIGEKVTDYQKNLLDLAVEGDECLKDINLRLCGKTSCFTDKIVWDTDILQTITAGGKIFRGKEKTKISHQDIINACTFPQDYNFMNENPRYVCGMSVPPLMILRVVTRLIEGGVFGVTK